jgi:hypothetical protein
VARDTVMCCTHDIVQVAGRTFDQTLLLLSGLAAFAVAVMAVEGSLSDTGLFCPTQEASSALAASLLDTKCASNLSIQLL